MSLTSCLPDGQGGTIHVFGPTSERCLCGARNTLRRQLQEQKGDSASLLPADPISEVQTEALPASSIRMRIALAGTGWCAVTHQHDNTKAAFNAAREALRIAKVNIEHLAKNCVNQHRGAYADVITILDALIFEIGSGNQAAPTHSDATNRSEAPKPDRSAAARSNTGGT